MDNLSRAKMLIGRDKISALKKSKVIVFGVGGVGGFAVEALARSGVGSITVVDADRVEESNINRQIIALNNTIGKDKVEVVKCRVSEIDSTINVNAIKMFYLPDTANLINLSDYDYIIDAIDTVSAKIELIKRAKEQNINIISCMGTGFKLNPTMLKVEDISKTSVCPLARVMRRELKKVGIEHLKVVYSDEEPVKDKTDKESDCSIIPSMIFVPACAGFIIASEVVKDLIK